MKKDGAASASKPRILARVLAKDLSKITGGGVAKCVETDAPDGQFPDDQIVEEPTTWLADG